MKKKALTKKALLALGRNPEPSLGDRMGMSQMEIGVRRLHEYHPEDTLQPINGYFKVSDDAEYEIDKGVRVLKGKPVMIITKGAVSVRSHGTVYAYNDVIVHTYGSAYVNAFDNVRVETSDTTIDSEDGKVKIRLFDKAYAEANSITAVKAYDHSVVDLWYPAKVDLYDNASVVCHRTNYERSKNIVRDWQVNFKEEATQRKIKTEECLRNLPKIKKELKNENF